jgi:hypothetical protein
MADFDAHDTIFLRLLGFFVQVPPMVHNDTPSRGFGTGVDKSIWWVKFSLDINHPLAWNVVQEFGYVLNCLSIAEPLPTVFKPVSPPPYLNGGPRDFLSWVIECPSDLMSPDTVAEWLEGGLPRPVDDISQWPVDEE